MYLLLSCFIRQHSKAFLEGQIKICLTLWKFIPNSFSASFNAPSTETFIFLFLLTFQFIFFFFPQRHLMGKCFSNRVEEIHQGTQRGSTGSALWYCVYLPLGYFSDSGLLPINNIYFCCYRSNTAGVWVVAWCHFVWQQAEITIICILGGADVELLQTYYNAERQNKQINTILFPIMILSCYLLSCHTAVRSNNIGVNFYSELSSEFFLWIFLAVKSSITACPRYNGASACFFSYDRSISALLLFIQNLVKTCVGFFLKQHSGYSHLSLFA